MKAFPLTLMLLASTAVPVAAATVAIGNHPGFGRVVLKLDGPGPVSVGGSDAQVQITATGETQITAPTQVPRNVISVAGGAGTAVVTTTPGAKVKTTQAPGLLIIDVFDPPRPDRATLSVRPNPAAAPATASTQPANSKPSPPPSTSALVTAEPSKPAAPPSANTPAGAGNPKPAPAPVASTSSEPAANKPAQGHGDTPKPPGSSETSSPAPQQASAPAASQPADEEPAPHAVEQKIRVLAGPGVGAVAFRRGDVGIVVFDDRVTVDRSDETADPSWGTVQEVQSGTMLILPMGGNASLALRRDADGWTVRPGPASGSPAQQTATDKGIQFQLGQPGRVMTISDPVTGQTLLLGTSRQGRGERNMNDVQRNAPGYTLLPTWLGLALEANSDVVDLRPSPSGYTLSLADRTAPGSAAAPVRDNELGIPIAPAETLVRQLSAQIASAAAAPPRGRGPERVAAARTMLALGMDAEAQALLTLAATDDPNVARDPAASALTGVAAVLAGRPGEASGLDNPALPTGGDIALWRGLRDAMLDKDPEALGRSWPAMATYPARIRQQIAPIVIESALKHGIAVPESELEGTSLGLARALDKQIHGDVDGALALLDSIANSANERDSVRATIAATELRLEKGLITPAAAAEKLEGQSFRWRGDGQELTIRLRTAELRASAKQFRTALQSLRDTETTFPDAKARIATVRSNVVQSLLASQPNAIPPLELVSIAGDFADAFADGPAAERMAGLLADKLAALDLPSRAIPVLQKLMEKATSDTTKAEFALRLAQLQIDAGDPAKAETALTDLDDSVLSPDRREQRLMLLARAKAARGDPAGAAMLLGAISSPTADEMRATLFAQARDWPHSLEALQSLAAKTVPDTGDLTDVQQDLLLREATAAVQAGDSDALRRLEPLQTRMQPPRADLFRVLTAPTVRSPGDLPRAARELAMTRSLPDRIDALKLR